MELTKGKDAYRYVSEVFEKVEVPYKEDFLKRKPGGSAGQSWSRFKGDAFEKLLQYIITEPIEKLGLKVVNGNRLGSAKLPEEVKVVKDNVTINYGEFKPLFPDADIIIYNPENSAVVAVLSSKISLRERITHTGYWKFKFLESEKTEHIKLYLITLDKDKHLTRRKRPSKQRTIAEIDLDGTYVLTAEELEESEKVKLFEHFIEDLKQVMEESQ
jgi:type II restriction enzyme